MTAITAPPKPKAAVWLSSVGEGGWLKAIRPGISTAAQNGIADFNGENSPRNIEGFQRALREGHIKQGRVLLLQRSP